MRRTMTLACVLAAMVWLRPGASPAATRTWDGGAATNLASNPTNWDGNLTAPTVGDDIVLNSTSSRDVLWDLTNVASIGSWLQTADYTGTVTIYTVFPGVAAYTNLHITGNVTLNNGAWTHRPNPSGATEVNRLRVSIDGNLTLQSPGRIDVTAKGYAMTNGPGSAGGTPPRQGAGHGGEGGVNYSGTYTPWTLPSPTYGSVKAPVRLGSGSSGGPGGGAIYITVGGQTTHNGYIAARGGDGGSSGGPAGGSIYLVTDTLVGNGTNDASGGTSVNRGGGGGGRVAVVLTSGNSFDAVTSIATGTLSTAVQGTPGAAGTVYLQKQSQAGAGTLIINGGGLLPQDTSCITLMPASDPVNLNTDFSEIILTNRANLGVATNTTLNLADLGKFKLYGASQSAITLRGTNLVTIPNPLVVSNYTLALERPMTLNGDVLVVTNSALTHTRNYERQTYGINLAVNGNLTVAPGGAISADYCGYWAAQGPGAGSANTDVRRGGCYGGEGGARAWSITNGVTYGSALAPTNLGSGGAAYAGGGVVRLVVGGETKVDGRISAAGYGPNAGAGAGGSVYLTTGTLTGDGRLDASGAPGVTANYGGGGGGRVAVILTSGDTFGAVSMSATGGVGGASSGAAGTVYKQTAGQGAGKGVLIVDNRAVPWPTIQTNVTCLPARTNGDNVADLLNVALVITNTAMVKITQNIGLSDLYVGSATSRFDLAYGTVTVYRVQHPLGLGANSVINYGSILWIAPTRGPIITAR